MVDLIAHRQTASKASHFVPITIPDSEHLAGLRRAEDASSRWGTKEQISRYGYRADTNAPRGFWNSDAAVAEAKRRIDDFVVRNGVVPMSQDMAGLGLSYFYKVYKGAGKSLHEIMTLVGHEKTRRNWNGHTKEEIMLFGLAGGPKTPKGFWEHEDGIVEAARRIRAFVDDMGYVPMTMAQLKALGITGFYESLLSKGGSWIRNMMEITGTLDERLQWEMAEKASTYGLPGVHTPTGFWQSDAGLEEGIRRVEIFLRVNGRLPTIKDLRPLGVEQLYRSRFDGYVDMLRGLGYDDETVAAHFVRRARKGEGKTDAVRAYGLVARAPVGFWKSAQGWEEALRRLMAFANERGRLPNGNEFVMKLGLSRFYEENVTQGKEYQEGLKEMFRQADELLRYGLISSKRN